MKELLAEFGLDDTYLNRKRFKENKLLLKFQQELYMLQVLYPNLHFIDLFDFRIHPLELEPPPRILTQLYPNSKYTLDLLELNYKWLIIPKEISKSNSVTTQNFYAKLNLLKHSYVIEERYNHKLHVQLQVINDELWFQDNNYQAPLFWFLSDYKPEYLALKENHRLYTENLPGRINARIGD